MRKIVNLLISQNSNSFLEREQSIWEKLRGAYILRGTTITILQNFAVRYDLFSELTALIVVSTTVTRQWGSLDDIAELSTHVTDVFSDGIILVDHSNSDCHWLRGHIIIKLEILQSLRRVATSSRLLMLARTRDVDGYFLFSHVQAKNKDKRLMAQNWLRYFLLERSIRVNASFAFPLRPMRSRMSDVE